MKHHDNLPMVTTIKERCRVCFTCVRECPARAIRIADGQAEVIEERCIGCGNCVRVCSQHAKNVLSGVDDVLRLLASEPMVVACIAPSFPAEFAGMSESALAGMVRALGFHRVVEVSFGADLVARRYRRLLSEQPGRRFIATSCPAIVGYVERYHPELVGNLAPIVSPMVAMSRVVKRHYGAAAKVVFVGPCIAKKGEAASLEVLGEVDAVLTFAELREMFVTEEVTEEHAGDGGFDPPRGGLGALFPISRGMLQAAGIHENLMQGDIVATDGRLKFVDAVQEFASGALDARLLEVLCCNGCIMGAGMTCNTPLFRRRSQVSHYVREQMTRQDLDEWEETLALYADLDLSRVFTPNDQRLGEPSAEVLRGIMERMGKQRKEDELNCGACGYDTCAQHAVAIYKGRAEAEMCLPYTIDQLRKTVRELASTQEALVNSEKMASMGQLAAGIAHEVNNPLGVVLMYAHLMLEDLPSEAREREDLSMIVQHADRCKKIVAGLLDFARQNKVERHWASVRGLVDRLVPTLRPPESITVRVEQEGEDLEANLDTDQIVQVLTNLANNAIGAMEGQESGVLTFRIGGDAETVLIQVSDTGTGISEENRKKIFSPFFTTKEAGKGTGLGLAVSYGIIKMHQGDIRVVSNTDPRQGPTGSTFQLTLPRNAAGGAEGAEEI